MWYSWHVLCSTQESGAISPTNLRFSHVAQPPAAVRVTGGAPKFTMWGLRSATRADEW
ncbi:unnamed protein product [Ectocarpus sp. 12 AP-2014]